MGEVLDGCSREVLLSAFAAAIDFYYLRADEVVDMVAPSTFAIFLGLDDAASMAYGRGPGIGVRLAATATGLMIALGAFHDDCLSSRYFSASSLVAQRPSTIRLRGPSRVIVVSAINQGREVTGDTCLAI